MALYNQKDFIADVKKEFHLSDEQSNSIAKQILRVKITKTSDWDDFNSQLKEVIYSSFLNTDVSINFPEVEIDKQLLNIPNYAEATKKEEIIQYLDAIKGNNIEENLKRLFLNSQLEKNIKYNYFYCIFTALLSQQASNKHVETFLLCYTMVLVTQKVSHTSLKSLITIYADRCSEGLDSSLQAQLSGDASINYEQFKIRSSFLRLVYALRIVDDSDSELAIKKSKDLLMTHCCTDGYDPRSFLDMVYYYVLMNGKSSSVLERMLRKTAVGVILKTFGEQVSEKAAEEFVKNWSSAQVKSFLNLNKESLKKCIPLLQSNGITVTAKQIISMAEEKFKRMHVNYFDYDVTQKNEDSYTYQYFLDTVEPLIDPKSGKHMKSSDFCVWMASQRQYYECYYNVSSRTRFEDFFDVSPIDFATDYEQYAYEIVQMNSLSKNVVSDFKPLGTSQWKTEIRKLETYEQKFQAVQNLLDSRLDTIAQYNGDGELAIGIRIYATINRKELYSAIVDEVNKMPFVKGEVITRADYLLKIFHEYAEEEELATSFAGEVDREMEDKRWEPFNPMRYQDALLYMCMNCDEPERMFREITEMDGYDYYQD